MDRNVISFINKRVADGMSDVHEMQRHIKSDLKTNFTSYASDVSNRRFHPTNKAVADHMFLAGQRLMHSKDDQKNLKAKIDVWKAENPGDRYFYRVKNDGEEKQDFLFVYQAEHHQRLLKRYGSIGLLDATYKTTKYSLPLFFICVKTNVDYQVVGAFMCEHESKNAIKEGLSIFSGWNQDWHPSYFMTDFDEKEIDSIEEVFDDCFVYLCDFHREQAWTRWVNKIEHKVRHVKGEVLARLRRVARSYSIEDYQAALNALFESTIWKENVTLQNWFKTYWLPHHEVSMTFNDFLQIILQMVQLVVVTKHT